MPKNKCFLFLASMLMPIVLAVGAQNPQVAAQTQTCIPTLLSPADGANLDNGRTDQMDNVIWVFDWSDCPGARAYHLHIRQPGAIYTAGDPEYELNLFPTDSSYTLVGRDHSSIGYFIPNSNRSNWTWEVNALIENTYYGWSETRTFDIEPVNSDDPGPPLTPTPIPTPTPRPPTPCIPTLLSPADFAILDNGRSDQLDDVVWVFDWSDCLGAQAYHLHIRQPGLLYGPPSQCTTLISFLPIQLIPWWGEIIQASATSSRKAIEDPGLGRLTL